MVRLLSVAAPAAVRTCTAAGGSCRDQVAGADIPAAPTSRGGSFRVRPRPGDEVCAGARVALTPDMGHAMGYAAIKQSADAHDASIELVPEIMVPAQFDDLRRSGVVTCGEHRLMLAVLEDAVHLYQIGRARGDTRARRVLGETERWFASEETTSPFSFVTICQVFGLDPDYLRAGLRRWRARREVDRPTSGAMPLRIRHVSGSRHRVTMPRRLRGSDADGWDQ